MIIMKEITYRQQRILDFLNSHFEANRYWPTIREIQKKFKYKSTNAVTGHLKALESKGAITRISGRARCMKVDLTQITSPKEISSNTMELPIYGRIPAGYPDGVESSGEVGKLQLNASCIGIRPSPSAFALRVSGDSMIDAGIEDGDLVIMENDSSRNGDIVAALIDGEVTLKRLVNEPESQPFLKAENRLYPELYPTQSLEIQGVARALIRKL